MPPPSQLRQVSTDHACREPALRISTTAAKGFPRLARARSIPGPDPSQPCKPRHVPRVWLSVTYTSVPSCAVHVAATEGRVQQKGRRFEAKPARRCPSGLLMMRGWNHTTMMRNVLDITRASLSLVHDACASCCTLVEQRGEQPSLSQRGGDMKDTTTLTSPCTAMLPRNRTLRTSRVWGFFSVC